MVRFVSSLCKSALPPSVPSSLHIPDQSFSPNLPGPTEKTVPLQVPKPDPDPADCTAALPHNAPTDLAPPQRVLAPFSTVSCSPGTPTRQPYTHTHTNRSGQSSFQTLQHQPHLHNSPCPPSSLHTCNTPTLVHTATPFRHTHSHPTQPHPVPTAQTSYNPQ